MCSCNRQRNSINNIPLIHADVLDLQNINTCIDDAKSNIRFTIGGKTSNVPIRKHLQIARGDLVENYSFWTRNPSKTFLMTFKILDFEKLLGIFSNFSLDLLLPDPLKAAVKFVWLKNEARNDIDKNRAFFDVGFKSENEKTTLCYTCLMLFLMSEGLPLNWDFKWLQDSYEYPSRSTDRLKK